MNERFKSWVQIPAGAAGEFSSPGSTFCADSYFGIHSIPMLLQSHVKDPGHSANSAGGRLYLLHFFYIFFIWFQPGFFVNLILMYAFIVLVLF